MKIKPIKNSKLKIKNYGLFLTFILHFTFYISNCLYSAPPGIDVGNKSVDFSLKVLSSTEIFKLSNYDGKNPVLLNFFATWCPYCVEEIPELNKIHNEYGRKGLLVASINVQERESKVADFVKRKKILYKILLDANSEVSKKFKVYGIPTNILIDSKGVIVFRGNNLPDEKDIESVLPRKKTKK
ncbi:MAG: alkyl hydroperoxide reductase [Elusimicrobia bacterium HGW-Elusimicrobia-4]|nr:MAG: alkyl hydroperoxide reductase [Elusimicrobia bacterium HGW-Elusimicrobia-4]